MDRRIMFGELGFTRKKSLPPLEAHIFLLNFSLSVEVLSTSV
jgi:hypothetical protein